jgi:tetratricopeptide (TPR) repeat protein
LRQAIDTSRRSLQIRRRLQDVASIPYRLLGIGIPLLQLGEFAAAQRHLRSALLVAAEHGDRYTVSMALNRLAWARLGLGQLDMAMRLCRAARTLTEEIGHKLGTAESYVGEGRVHQARGEYAAAIEDQRRALALARETGEPRGMSLVLNDLSASLTAAGEVVQARAMHEEALLTAGGRHPYEVGRAHAGIAALIADADPMVARGHWRQAAEIFERMGVPERFAVRQRLVG